MTPSRWLVPGFAGVVLYGLAQLLIAAPPIAQAGPDLLDVPIGTPVTLSATASSDPAGRPLTFAWKFVSRPAGSAATLLNPTSATPSFTPDRNGTYEVGLTVKAGAEVATDTVVVITRNHPPTADAGADTGAPIGKRVRLRGIGTDPDLDKLTFAWTLLSAPGSSRAALLTPTKASTTLTLDRPGTYVAQFRVTDPFGASAIDAVEITHVNSAPVAAAGPDLDVPVGAVVRLDASGSTDVDEDPLTYTWTLVKPKGSTASISDPDALQPSLVVDVAGTYAAILVAHDGTVASKEDTLAITTSPLNARPVANAGPDQRIAAGQTIHVDGSRSHDPNGQSLSYAWTLTKQPKASAATLSSAAVRPTFTADIEGTYGAKLIVTDSAGRASIADTIVLTTGNVAPVANAGNDGVAAVGTPVQLHGSRSSDVDGDELAFGWALLHAPVGSTATLSKADAVNPAFTPDLAGTYQFQLIVNDGLVNGTPDTVVVTTENVRPRAAAGPDKTVTVGSPVGLDGSASSDANADPLVFSWTLAARPTGSAATLSDPSSPAPGFVIDVAGDYVAQLRVFDGIVWSAPDAVVVTTGNSVPVAEAGADQIVAIGPVALTGAGSSDADDDPLTYRWSFTARPEGSAAVLAGATELAPAFTADVTGTYVAQLIVRDGVVESQPNTVVIVAGEAPPPPPPGPTDFQLFAPASRILPKGRVSAAVVLETAAGSSGVDITLVASDVALIDVPSSVTVPAGETSVWFEVAALTKLGSATVSAEIAGVGVATAEFTVSQESTGVLIERAQASGEISEEQAYVYRVFAAYGWPGLPEKFRGAQSSKGRDPQMELLTEVRLRFSSLSPTAQEQLAPLLAPPIYVGSWGDPDVLAAATASARSDRSGAAGDKPRPPSIQGVILCSEGSTPQRLPVWDNYEVGPFRIWYLSDPLPYKTYIGTPEQSRRLADVAKSEISAIYSKLHGVFGRDLIPDEAVGGCNGGDGKYDIYMYGLSQSLAFGSTYPYRPTEPLPSWIALSAASNWGPTNTLIRATLAHELMHAIYFVYPRADWAESFWLTEALAGWAENFVYRNGNTEWDYADYLFSHESSYKGAVVADILLPLPTATTDIEDKSDLDRSASRAISAASKYVFFFYLQNKFSPAVLRTILDEGVSVKSMTAIDRALSGHFSNVWADFVVTAWNDTKNGVKNEFSQWDPGMKHGLFLQFETDFLFSVGNFPTHTFGLEEPEKLVPFISAPVTKAKGAYVPPAAGHWMRAKFTDASTSFVVLHPSRPKPDGTELKMQALFKANGKWSPPIDLSHELLKVWCRDRPADKFPEHKLEEIVLIASNGRLPPTDGSSSADWDWFDGGSPAKDLIPNLVVSNAGCWQWTGRSTSSVEYTALNGVMQVNEATGFTFELDDDGLHTAALLGEAHLNLVASPEGFGTATYQISGTTAEGCTYRGGPTPKAITTEMGAVSIVFTKWLPIDVPSPPESRTVIGGGSDPDPPTMIVTCPTGDPVEMPVPWPHWMILLSAPPQDRLAKISPDGGLLSGTFNIDLELAGTAATTVNLNAVRK